MDRFDAWNPLDPDDDFLDAEDDAADARESGVLPTGARHRRLQLQALFAENRAELHGPVPLASVDSTILPPSELSTMLGSLRPPMRQRVASRLEDLGVWIGNRYGSVVRAIRG